MVVVPLESLPLGFRFHPTDEELVSHYLKGKINGRKPQVEVIPEIDVCKYEPWDLPGKSLIRTVDPEWFFFAPRDRKYPNGPRSNRATTAGYWKATGKDRTIKSRTSSGNVLIGKKKTLVFYCGRAPKGERTGWIMHEYRTVENEVDGAAGDQGAYLLCRLFKKPLERTPTTNYDELDEDGFSPTPTKSSPGNIEQAAEHGEEFDTAVDKKDLVQQMQEDQEPLTHIFEKHELLDEVIGGMHPPKPEDSNSNISQDVAAREVWPEDNNALNISFKDDCGPSPLEIIDNHEFAPVDSPNIDSNFPVNLKIVHGMSTSPDDLAEEDPITKFLDSVLCDPDEYSLEDSNSQRNSTADIRPEHIKQINGAEAGPLWDLPWDERFGSIGEVNAGLGPVEGEMENGACLPAIPNSWDFLISSGLEHNTESGCAGSEDFSAPWQLFNDLPDSTINMISLDGCDGFDSTGIKVRSRQSQHHTPQVSDQGTATRRIRLARKLQMECSMAGESSSNTVVHTTNALTTDVEEGTQEKVPKAEVGPVDIDKLGSSHDDEICSAEKAPDAVDLARESKSVLRHRQPKKDKTLSRGPTQNPRAKGDSASVYLAVGAVLLIILIMCFYQSVYNS